MPAQVLVATETSVPDAAPLPTHIAMLTGALQTYRLTILLSLFAIVAWTSPLLSQWMELNYLLVADGQWWRLWTGHLTHYDGSHLFWDLLMFAVLGAACEEKHPRRFGFGLIVMMAGVAGIVGLRCDEITVYRGLSGLDTGLFVWFVADQCRRCWMERDRLAALVWSSAVLGLISKLVFEATTGQTLFVESANFTPMVESHLAGAALGLLCAMLAYRTSGLVHSNLAAPAHTITVHRPYR